MTPSHDVEFWQPWCDVSLAIAWCGAALPWPDDGPQWLTAREQAELAVFRAPRRRREWLGGRWLSKRLLAGNSTTPATLRRWEIVSRASARRGCRPVVRRDDVIQTASLSLAHSDPAIAAAVGEVSGGHVGVDVVPRQKLPAGFAACWFSEPERSLLSQQDWSLADGWAVKEASFKAVNRGESFRPRQIAIAHITGDECAVEYQLPSGQRIEIPVRTRRWPHASIACAKSA